MQFLFHKFDIIGIEKKLIGLFRRRVLDQTSLNAQIPNSKGREANKDTGSF